jgi:hypothetical protein
VAHGGTAGAPHAVCPLLSHTITLSRRVGGTEPAGCCGGGPEEEGKLECGGADRRVDDLSWEENTVADLSWEENIVCSLKSTTEVVQKNRAMNPAAGPQPRPHIRPWICSLFLCCWLERN